MTQATDSEKAHLAKVLAATQYNTATRKPMKIGLDYDGTITNDPETFKQIAHLLREAGHEVYMTTMRYTTELCTVQANGLTINEEWQPHLTGIIATGRKAKRPFTKGLGIDIDVWIDDHPMAVDRSADEIWSRPTPEGVTIIESPHGPIMQVNGFVLHCNEQSWQVVRAYLIEKQMTLSQFLDVCYDPTVKTWLRERHLHRRLNILGERIATMEETISIKNWRVNAATGVRELAGTTYYHPDGSTTNVNEPGIINPSLPITGVPDRYVDEIVVLPIRA